MTKYIHYCWFGGKPLPKLARKCIKSWKKYLPDYEIIEWSEKNVDLDECPFIRDAYDKKIWAFVADYARTKAMYEHGGIYFDTDMIVTKNIDFLLDKETFLGLEDSNMVNAAVWGASKPKTVFAKKMLEQYKKIKTINDNDKYSYSIPRVITRILNEYEGFNPISKEIQTLADGITIYPRDYFYPLSYNHRNNIYTENTCMIHYFEATWIPKWEQRENKIFRLFGEKYGQKVITGIRLSKKIAKKGIKTILFPAVIYSKYRQKISNKYLTMMEETNKKIREFKNDYIILHNPEWFGVTSATIELFDNCVPCGEILRNKDIKKISNTIINNNVNQVIFSAMCIGWKELAMYLREQEPSIKIKVFWHGNHSQVSEPYGWNRNIELLEMQKSGLLDVFGTCKKTLIKFYETIGIKTTFITNKVDLPKNIVIENKKEIKESKVKIGLYAAKSDDWRKNMFAQIAAVGLVDNAVLDIVPLSPEATRFANFLKIPVEGIEKPIPRNELINRMSKNDINLYITFSECSPMLPLESFEAGVPCITGNNHHYWNDDELENYIVVDNEENILNIRDVLINTLKHKEKVMSLYKKFSAENKKQSKKDVKKFLEM